MNISSNLQITKNNNFNSVRNNININLIPTEIIRAIFYLLNNRDLRIVGSVCKNWKKIADNDPRLKVSWEQFHKKLQWLNGGHPLPSSWNPSELHNAICRLPHVMPYIMLEAGTSRFNSNTVLKLNHQKLFQLETSTHLTHNDLVSVNSIDVLTGKEEWRVLTDAFGSPLTKATWVQKPQIFLSSEHMIALYDQKLHIWDLSTGNYIPEVSLENFQFGSMKVKNILFKDSKIYLFSPNETEKNLNLYIYDLRDKKFSDPIIFEGEFYNSPKILLNKYLVLTTEKQLDQSQEMVSFLYMMDLESHKITFLVEKSKEYDWYFYERNHDSFFLLSVKEIIIYCLKTNKLKSYSLKKLLGDIEIFCATSFHQYLIISTHIVGRGNNLILFDSENLLINVYPIQDHETPQNMFILGHLLCSQNSKRSYPASTITFRNLLPRHNELVILDLAESLLIPRKITQNRNELRNFIFRLTIDEVNLINNFLLQKNAGFRVQDLHEKKLNFATVLDKALLLKTLINETGIICPEINSIIFALKNYHHLMHLPPRKEKIDKIPKELQIALTNYLVEQKILPEKYKGQTLNWLISRSKDLEEISTSILSFATQKIMPFLSLSAPTEQEDELIAPYDYYNKIAYYLLQQKPDKVQMLMKEFESKFPEIFKKFLGSLASFTNKGMEFFLNKIKTDRGFCLNVAKNCVSFLKSQKLDFSSNVLELIASFKNSYSPLSYFEALGETEETLSKETNISKGNLQKCGILTVEDLEALSIMPATVIELHKLSHMSYVFNPSQFSSMPDPKKIIGLKRDAMSSLIYRLEKILEKEKTFIKDLTKIIDNGNDKLYTGEYIEKSLKEPIADLCQKIQEDINNLQNTYQTPKLLQEFDGKCEKLKDIFSELLRLEIIRQKAIADLYLKQTGVVDSWNKKRGAAESLSEFQKLTEDKNSVADLLKFDTEVQAAPSKRSNDEQNEQSSKRSKTN